MDILAPSGRKTARSHAGLQPVGSWRLFGHFDRIRFRIKDNPRLWRRTENGSRKLRRILRTNSYLYIETAVTKLHRERSRRPQHVSCTSNTYGRTVQYVSVQWLVDCSLRLPAGSTCSRFILSYWAFFCVRCDRMYIYAENMQHICGLPHVPPEVHSEPRTRFTVRELLYRLSEPKASTTTGGVGTG